MSAQLQPRHQRILNQPKLTTRCGLCARDAQPCINLIPGAGVAMTCVTCAGIALSQAERRAGWVRWVRGGSRPARLLPREGWDAAAALNEYGGARPTTTEARDAYPATIVGLAFEFHPGKRRTPFDLFV